MVIVTALLTVKLGKEAELKALGAAMVEQVRHEPGAMEYTLHQGLQNPRQFFFYERYADKAACDTHMATPYLAAFLQSAGPLLDCEPQLNMLEEVVRIPVKDAPSRG